MYSFRTRELTREYRCSLGIPIGQEGNCDFSREQPKADLSDDGLAVHRNSFASSDSLAPPPQSPTREVTPPATHKPPRHHDIIGEDLELFDR